MLAQQVEQGHARVDIHLDRFAVDLERERNSRRRCREPTPKRSARTSIPPSSRPAFPIRYNALETVFDVAWDLKRKRALGEPHALLRDKVLAMLFFFSSTE